MSHTIADSYLYLNSQSLAVLAMLAQREPDFAEYDKENREYLYEATTAAWYNGRERGFSLVVRRQMTDRACTVITVAEHRSSDQIVIMSWDYEDKYFLNPPMVDDAPESAWAGSQHVDYGRIDLAVALIEKIVSRFLVSRAEVMGKPKAQPAAQPEVPQTWLDTVLSGDIYRSDYAGGWLAAFAHRDGWLAYESEELNLSEVDIAQAFVAWDSGAPLPEHWHRVDRAVAVKAYLIGVRIWGEGWYSGTTAYGKCITPHQNGGGAQYLLQLALFGEEKYS